MHPIHTPLDIEDNMLPLDEMRNGHLEELLDTDPTVVMRTMLKEQINLRCRIADLYGELLDAVSPSPQVVNASHNWNLAHIEAVCQDLRVNLPNHHHPVSIYSKYFVDGEYDPKKIDDITLKLLEALAQHQEISNQIDQYGKGLV